MMEQVKELIKRLKRTSPNIDEHIFKALDNISMDCILGWRNGKDHHSFLEKYDKK